jgi:predicted RNase H-like HicB family nuclease
MFRYEVIICRRADDQAFVADVPELPGCLPHGDTYEAALVNAQQAGQLWLDPAREFGDPVPEPTGRRLVYV